MPVEFPLVKEVEKIEVWDDQNGKYTDVEVITRDDGGVIHNILSQVDFNKSEYTKHRRNAMKIMKALRRWNFDHSRKESATGSITIEEGQLEFMNDVVVKDTPKDVKIFGLNALESILALEDFYDEYKKKAKDIDTPKSE